MCEEKLIRLVLCEAQEDFGSAIERGKGGIETRENDAANASPNALALSHELQRVKPPVPTVAILTEWVHQIGAVFIVGVNCFKPTRDCPPRPRACFLSNYTVIAGRGWFSSTERALMQGCRSELFRKPWCHEVTHSNHMCCCPALPTFAVCDIICEAMICS